ncbi:TatD family hydrolase [Bacillus thermotolerans]|uniref:Deoxyribonuclease n=1 Tax=Bacillus thermotolerans TaxID=1221996 RepID=A0A0F5HYD4_BACTR|nr:TatD family hydrolase [Bacillus thermotolerans]KKB38321.1 putative deoxyribonuclease [Bacillus thermotolerans]KKB39868.1 putative deoxyribonuclease [Bacillus thermotolerans]
MYGPLIDAHIHFDQYSLPAQARILEELKRFNIDALISVSTNLSSSKKTLDLASQSPHIYAAAGFHPEQALPKEQELSELQQLIFEHQEDLAAIGEVGLPYYLRKENRDIPLEPYIEVLESFIRQAAALRKPLALHAVYEDAAIVCELLEKHSITKAHFHWFKGSKAIIDRLKHNGYFISVTPDLLYKERTEQLVQMYPLTHIMVETDGPWPFEGPFQRNMTHPKMIHETIRKLAAIKKMRIEEVYSQLYENTKRFYL